MFPRFTLPTTAHCLPTPMRNFTKWKRALLPKTVYTVQLCTRDAWYAGMVSICWEQHLNFIRKSLHLKVFKCVETDLNFPLSVGARRLCAYACVCVCVSSVHALGIIGTCRLFSTFYPFFTESSHALAFSVWLTYTPHLALDQTRIFIHYGIRVSIYLVHFNISDYMYIHNFPHSFIRSFARSLAHSQNTPLLGYR